MSITSYFKSDKKEKEPEKNKTGRDGSPGSGPNKVKIPSDLGEADHEPVQPKLASFNPKQYGNSKRDFSASWYNGRTWLEYSVEKGAAFCFPCRHFKISSKDCTYTKEGYSNWRHALDKHKGFKKHEISHSHVEAMVIWQERKMRIEKNQSVSTMVNEKQLEKNRYYIKSVVEVIQFLCVNELPMRGDGKSGGGCLSTSSESRGEPSGLFMKLFQYTLSKDRKLSEIMQMIPQNASYTSARIQNEIIDIMKDTVMENVVNDIKEADIPFFSIKADGTRDPTNTENISVVVRYVKGGKVKESLIGMPTTDDYDAESLASLILKTLNECGLDCSNILSQCYDGASVMSGQHGGVQKKLQEKLQKQIPYVHCFNHQLHLVVVHAIGMQNDVEMFFSVCNSLYNFLRRPKLVKIYDGTKLKRLLEQRWSGHLGTVSTILENHEKIVDALESCEENGCDAAICIEATGLLKQIRSRKYMFIAYCVHAVLSLIKPADKLLQSSDCDLMTGTKLIESVVCNIKDMRNDVDIFEGIITKLSDRNLSKPEDVHNIPKRSRKLPAHLAKDSIVEASVGHSEDSSNAKSEATLFRQIYCSIVDNCLGELNARFGERSSVVTAAISCLWPEPRVSFLDPKKIAPLASLIGLNTDSFQLQSECQVASTLIEREFDSKSHKTLHDLCLFLHPYRKGFNEVYQLYAAALTFGSSNAVCEESFSTLSRVLVPYRRSMTHKRKSNLVLLSFLSDYTQKINMDEFLHKFAARSRKIQLY